MADQLPPDIAPHPIPLGFIIDAHPSGFVVIRIVDATGQRVIFLDKDTAKAFQEQLNRAVGAAASGLILP